MDLQSSSRVVRMIRTAAGLSMVAFGLFAVGYFGIWWALVRGIFHGMFLIHHQPIPPASLAVDVIRIGSSSVIGWGGTVFVLVGVSLLLPSPRQRQGWSSVPQTCPSSNSPDRS